jgi:uncharacterized tellurite resistance protein B-like protein
MGKFSLSKAEVNALTDDQRAAIFDALVVSVFADGAATPEEIARFEHEVAEWGDADKNMKLVAASREKVSKLASQKDADDFVSSVARRISGKDLREKLFRMMASLAFADSGVNEHENNVLNDFQAKFEIPDERLPEIAAEVRGN